MVDPDRSKLGGTVEVDEMFVSGMHKAGKPGRSYAPDKTPLLPVAKVLPKGIGRCRLVVMSDQWPFLHPSPATTTWTSRVGHDLLDH